MWFADLGAIKSTYMPTILGEVGGEDAEEGRERVVVRETVKTVHVKAFHQKPFQASCHKQRIIHNWAMETR